MAVIEKFLGRRVTLPDNLRYFVKQGLWARLDDSTITFGFSEPALTLSGGIQDLNFLADDGETVEQGQSVLFAITGKILYIDSPVQGIIRFNAEAKTDPAAINQDPYYRGWLFAVIPADPAERLTRIFRTARLTWKAFRTVKDSKTRKGSKAESAASARRFIRESDAENPFIERFEMGEVYVEIVAEQKGCILWDRPLLFLKKLRRSLRRECCLVGGDVGTKRPGPHG